MKKFLATVLTILLLISTASLNSYADRGGHRGGGGHSGHGGGVYYGHGGGGSHVGVDILLGPWWGPVYPYYSYYPFYPYFTPPPVVPPPQPDVYLQPAPQAQENDYWFYCRNPEGYYPYVKRCPDGWLRVVPSPPAGEKE